MKKFYLITCWLFSAKSIYSTTRLSRWERYNFKLCFIRNQDGGMKGWEAQTTNDIVCQALCLALRNFKPYPVWLENQDLVAFKPSHECDKRQRNYTRRQLNSRSFSRMRPYSYASLKLSNLPRLAVTRYTHPNHEPKHRPLRKMLQYISQKQKS